MKILFTLLTYLLPAITYAQFGNVAPDKFIENPKFDQPYIDKKQDSTGGVNMPSPPANLNGNCLIESLKNCKGFDLSEPCASLGYSFVTDGLCEQFTINAFYSYGGQNELVKMQSVAGLSYNTPNCLAVSDTINNSIGAIPKQTRDAFDHCRVFCSNAPNTENARKFCGLDTCLAKGSKSDWCRYITKSWSTEENNTTLRTKLNSYDSSTSGTSFANCLNKWLEHEEGSEACCTYTKQFSNYDKNIGQEFGKYCTYRAQAAACKNYFMQYQTAIPDCCPVYEAYDKDITKHQVFKGYSHPMLRARIRAECE